MRRCIILDTGVLGIVSNPKAMPLTVAGRQWIGTIVNNSDRIIIPEIADYELRRELIRANKFLGIRNLDVLISQVDYLPLTTTAMRQAAQFWADARQQGYPTADNKTIDGDVILAAQASTLGVTDFVIATTNVRHLTRFVPAELWQDIS